MTAADTTHQAEKIQFSPDEAGTPDFDRIISRLNQLQDEDPSGDRILSVIRRRLLAFVWRRA